MKKALCLILSILMVLSCSAAACADSVYTLPEKMQKQLQVGSGLKGSFVIHGHVNPEKHPLINALANTEFEIRGIRSGEDLYYYIYQPGENDTLAARTELYRSGKSLYLRSDMLDASAYLLPGVGHIADAYLHAEGENPSVFSDLLRILLEGKINSNEAVNTELLEKQLEDWINMFPSERTIQSSENSTPRLVQVFTIPMESMYNMVTDLIKLIARTDTAMKVLRSFLTGEQIATYFTPDLTYYYKEAMDALDLEGNIVFSRTVSTMGEVLESSLSLPMSEKMTGFTSLVIRNDESRMNLQLTGKNGLLFVEAPLHFDPKAELFEEDFRFVRVYGEETEKENLSLLIRAKKDHAAYADPEDESLTHETDRYTVRITRDTAMLPDGISEDRIPDFDETEAALEIHYFSKLKPSSKTTAEFTFSVKQGVYDLDATGSVNTDAPWTFTPFDVSSAADLSLCTKEDIKNLRDAWISKAEAALSHTPEEIRLTETELTGTDIPEVPEAAEGGAEEIVSVPDGAEDDTSNV